MGQPITWRNVEAPDFRGAASMLQMASNTLGSGFDKIGQVLKDEQATAEANWKVQRDNNTQAFLNSINQYRTADEYQAAQKSGIFDQLRQQYGAQVDQNAIRAAEDGRLAILQGRDVQAINYGNTMTDAKEDPIKRAATMAILSGDKATYDRIVAENPNARFLPEVAGKNRDITHQNVTWDQEAKTFDDNLKTNAARRIQLAASANRDNAAADHYRAENSNEKVALKTALANSKAQNAAADLLIKNSPMDAGTLAQTEGKMKFLEGLKKMGIDGDVAQNILKEFGSNFGAGVKVGDRDLPDGKKEDVRIGLPVSTALAAVEAAGPDAALRPNWLVGSGRGGRAVAQVAKLLEDAKYSESIAAALQAQGIQYRPLTKVAIDPEPKAVSGLVSRQRIGLPKPSNNGEFSGSELVSQSVASRLEKAKAMMTPAEIEAAKTGHLPARIKQYLYEANDR